MKLHITICILLLVTTALAQPQPEPDPDTTTNSNSIDLTRYVVKKGPLKVKGVDENLSGVVFHPTRKTLFAVINSPSRIVELSPEGKLLRRTRLSVDDPEGLALINDNELAISAEGKGGTIILAQLPEESSGWVKILKRVPVFKEDYDNFGLEGVAYDPIVKRFLSVKEKHPPRLFQTDPTKRFRRTGTQVLWDFDRNTINLSDVAGVHFHQASRHLLVVSHESSCLVECTLEGKEISRLKLSLAQAEGVTMDPEGNIYVVGEPNTLVIFSKEAASK